jgi:hypothetical protein
MRPWRSSPEERTRRDNAELEGRDWIVAGRLQKTWHRRASDADILLMLRGKAQRKSGLGRAACESVLTADSKQKLLPIARKNHGERRLDGSIQILHWGRRIQYQEFDPQKIN